MQSEPVLWPDGPLYVHTWSLFESISRAFEQMSSAPPLDEQWQAILERGSSEYTVV
jgi:hypothetical protein